jgi:hypothetical protein
VDRYTVSFGPTYALATVVDIRSYSRICERTSEEIEMNAPGISSATISRMRLSCASFRKENSVHTATAFTPSFLNTAQARRTSSSTRGWMTAPR